MATMTIRNTIDVRDGASNLDIALACEELLGDMGHLKYLPLLESCALYVALKDHIHSETGLDPDHFMDQIARLVS